MFRYLDNVVFALRRRSETEAFFRALPALLASFDLELSPGKTRLVRFSRFHLGRQAESFEFLGVEFRWLRDLAGTPRVKRRTSRR